ncbi:MAG TPA: hypothetical protein PKC85_11765 [Bacteroidia bacterium]|jgi:hypothetical protein|nr:hypothetical protein [Bacteroidia bacterium]HMU20508.1 hypothetical protein [Bacteroidia bacterium]
MIKKLLIAFLLLFNGLLFADNGTNQELILRINELSDSKRQAQIETILNTTDGIVSKEYCYSLNCVMLIINSVEYNSKEVLLNKLKSEGFTFTERDGVTIMRVKQACKDSNNSDMIKNQ